MCILGPFVWLSSYAGAALVVARDAGSPDAIMSLGSHEWERLPVAARLAEDGPAAAVVLLSQPMRPNPKNCHLCSQRVGWLQELGVPPDRIVLLPRLVRNTYDEALSAREYCEQHSIGSLLVVTSPYHARRTLATFLTVFEGSGTTIGVRPALEQSPARPGEWWAHPYDRAYVRYELAGLVWYAIRHHVSPRLPD